MHVGQWSTQILRTCAHPPEPLPGPQRQDTMTRTTPAKDRRTAERGAMPQDAPAAPTDEGEARAQAVVERILGRAGTALQAEQDGPSEYDGDQLDAEERAALRRIAGLSTELDDVTEVEYRELRLEKVVL